MPSTSCFQKIQNCPTPKFLKFVDLKIRYILYQTQIPYQDLIPVEKLLLEITLKIVFLKGKDADFA